QRAGKQMHAIGDAILAEQHDAQEGGLEEKGGENFVAQQRASNIARVIHESRPVGAELEAHGDAGDDTDGEAQGEDPYPELVGVVPVRVAGAGVAHAKVNQQPGEADGDGGEEYVETNVGGEL